MSKRKWPHRPASVCSVDGRKTQPRSATATCPFSFGIICKENKPPKCARGKIPYCISKYHGGTIKLKALKNENVGILHPSPLFLGSTRSGGDPGRLFSGPLLSWAFASSLGASCPDQCCFFFHLSFSQRKVHSGLWLLCSHWAGHCEGKKIEPRGGLGLTAMVLERGRTAGDAPTHAHSL